MKPANSSSRKKFLWWSAAALVSAAVIRLFGKSKQQKSETVKMLAQDGSLVEVDKELLTKGKKITNEELQQWIKK